MSESIKRLLFTGEPYPDESFIGYLARLAELNEIPELKWIFKHVTPSNSFISNYKFNLDFKVDLDNLSRLTGVAKERLELLLYRHEIGRTRIFVGNIIVFGRPLLHHLVKRENPKICPVCLAEAGYCRRTWEFSPVTACPYHQCLLIDHCGQCQKQISWERKRLCHCQCEFDFRLTRNCTLKAEDLRLTRYFLQYFSLPVPGEKIEFAHPIDKLSANDLIRLFYFVAAISAGSTDYTGTSIAKSMNNIQNHEHLCRAINIFDSWPAGYHQLIRDWKNQDKRYFINCKYLYNSKIGLRREHAEYEMFNQLLHNYFDDEKFAFLHREFAIFLDNQHPGELPPGSKAVDNSNNSPLVK